MKSKQEGQNQDLIRYKHIKQEKKYRSHSITTGRQKSGITRPTEALQAQWALQASLMHRFGIRATVMRSSNFWMVFASSGASNEWSRTWQNSLMETYPFLLQEPWRSLAFPSTLLDHNSLQCNHKCCSVIYSTLEINAERQLLIFPQYNLSHYHSCMITMPAKKKTKLPTPQEWGTSKETLASVFGRLLGPCMFPSCHNQYNVLDGSPVTCLVTML